MSLSDRISRYIFPTPIDDMEEDPKKEISPPLLLLLFSVSLNNAFALVDFALVLIRAQTWRTACTYFLLVVFETLILAVLVHIARGNMCRLHSVRVHNDLICLLFGLNIPISNLIWALYLPSFDVTKRNFRLGVIFVQMLNALAFKLPKAHLFTASLLFTPFCL